jgi:hypothetical protein
VLLAAGEAALFGVFSLAGTGAGQWRGGRGAVPPPGALGCAPSHCTKLAPSVDE